MTTSKTAALAAALVMAASALTATHSHAQTPYPRAGTEHHTGASVRGRQRHRHHDTPDLERIGHRARRYHRDRQQARRQRIDRGELCRALGAGRLHAVRHDEHVAFGQSVSPEKHDLRSDQGFHPDRADRRPAVHAGDQSRNPGQFRRRTRLRSQRKIPANTPTPAAVRRRSSPARRSPTSPGSIFFMCPTRVRRRR